MKPAPFNPQLIGQHINELIAASSKAGVSCRVIYSGDRAGQKPRGKEIKAYLGEDGKTVRKIEQA